MNTININCPVGGTGYGITSLNIIKSLNDLGVDMSLFPMGSNIEINNTKEKELIEKLIIRSKLFNPNSPCLKIWHPNNLASRIGRGKFYSFPFFELDSISKDEIHHINSCDLVFTASDWGKKVLQSNNINIPVVVCPLGVDTDIFKTPNKIKIDEGKYVFFHIGKWEIRKGHDFLLKCFERAFDQNDNVELWLAPFNMFLNKEEESKWLDLVKANKLVNKIKIFNRFKTQYDLAEFIFYADCGVFLSRGEGWNNEILECMALNKPIIATNYSAHTEYLNKNNSFMININKTESAHDNKWFFGQGNWAHLGDEQIEQTVDYMRMVYYENIKDNPNGLISANQYSWNNTANIIKNTIFKEYHANSRKKKRRK
jgi:glycosyltransferase involved in cell wall biosynthesis